MINTAGAYILVLFISHNGITTVKLDSFEACQAALTQLEPTQVRGVCIAAEIIK